MAEQSTADEEAEKPSIFDQSEGVDWLLAQLIALADNGGVETGMTLQLGGLVISGVLISGREYFVEAAKITAAAKVTGTAGPDLAQVLARMMDQFKGIYPAAGAGEWDEGRKPTYIHLRNARIALPSGGASPPSLWRGKLTSVDGYVIGEMTYG